MTAITEKMVGPHRVVLEAEDVIALYFAASPTEGEMREVVDVEAELAAGRGVFLLIDLRRVDTISAGARRAIGEASKKLSFKGFAMYGAGFQMKVIAKLVNSALALFSKSQVPQEFFDSHDEARAWIDGRRREAAVGA